MLKWEDYFVEEERPSRPRDWVLLICIILVAVALSIYLSRAGG